MLNFIFAPKNGLTPSRLEAIGGVKGQNYMLSLYERAFQYEVSAFYGMLKFNSLLKIFAFECGWIWRKSDFSNINLYYKNIAKNGPNNNFLKPKMVLDFIFGGFSCISMVCIIKNPKMWYISRFWEILSKPSQRGRYDALQQQVCLHAQRCSYRGK